MISSVNGSHSRPKINMTIKVKQRQYGISIHGHAQTSLVTEDIWTCTGLVGVDKKSGTVFLAHFDLPTTAKSLPEIIDELKKHTNDLSGFKLYMVAGINPAIAAIFGGLAISCVFFQAWAFASAFIVCAGLLSMTRFAIRQQLRKLKVFQGDPIWLVHSNAWYGLGKCGVRINVGQLEGPEVFCYGRMGKSKEFNTPKHAGCRLSKADDSA